MTVFSRINFAILSPLPEELAFFQQLFADHPKQTILLHGFEFYIYEYKHQRILLSHTGLGTTFATCGATFIYHHFHPDYFLLLGTAGGLDPQLTVNDVVIIEKAFEAELQGLSDLVKETPFANCLIHPLNKQTFPSFYNADEELLAIASSIYLPDIKIYQGTGVSSNTFPAPRELFKKILPLSPFCIDMETSAIYQVAWLLKARALAIRGISNLLPMDGGDEKMCGADIAGSTRNAALVMQKILDTLIEKNNQLHTQQIHSAPHSEITAIVQQLQLQPHPEGGFYRRIFKSEHLVKSLDKKRYQDEPRAAGSSIYYLLTSQDFSAWHQVKSDEIWHNYKGSTVELYVISEQGLLTTHLLGDPAQYSGANFQVAVPAQHWMAAAVTDQHSFALLGCTLSPGFEFADWQLGDETMLTNLFPQHKNVIRQFLQSSTHS
jgi:hypothetical protein